MLETIVEQAEKATEPAADTADWTRYCELRENAKPTKKELEEFRELLVLLELTPAEAELHNTVLTEAEKFEALVRQEAEAAADEIETQQAEQKARIAVGTEIARLYQLIQTNNLPEIKARDAARKRCREILFAKSQLAQLYDRWPGLFSLPPNEGKKFYGAADLPTPIQEAARNLKIRL